MPQLALLIGLCFSAQPTHPELQRAEEAFAAGEYQQVLAPVQRALAAPLTLPERRRAHELTALVHAAFDESQLAIQAFVRVLKVDPHYEPAHASPKVRGLFAEARRLHGPRPAPPAAVASPPPAPPPETPLWKRGWFWPAAGAVLLGAGSAVYFTTRPRVPQGNLPQGELR